jgi:Protein of unknown function (DUF3800)
MLAAYFDDSGTHTVSDIVVMACIIGTEAEWSRFEVAWKAQLLKPVSNKPPLRRFHMTDCFNREKEFFGYSYAERDLVIKSFRDIILGNNLQGRAIGVARHAWDRLITGAHRLFFGDAESFCIRYCMDYALQSAINDPGSDKGITLIFDDGRAMMRRTAEIGEEKKRWHDGTKDYTAKMFGPCFRPVVNFVPLQAADIFAWETYAYGRGWLEDPAKTISLHYQRLIESERFTAGFMDAGKIEDLARVFS